MNSSMCKDKENVRENVSEKVRNVFRSEDGSLKCSLGVNCNFRPKSFVVTNCLRHIENFHPASFNVLKLGKEIPPETIAARGRKRPKGEEVVNVRVTKQKVVGGLIKIVTCHNAPFCAVEWEGVKDIVDPLLGAMNLTVNKQNIVRYVNETSSNIDGFIREEVKDTMVSLKLDTTSKMNRSVLAVSVQFYRDLQLVRRSLGVIELYEKHTAQYLKEKVEELLNKFGIKRWQIYSVTVDNGRNVVKAVDLLGEIETQPPDVQECSPQQDDAEDVPEDDDAFSHCEQITDEYEQSLGDHRVDCIRCGAHTLNLVVNDVTLASERDDETLKHIVKVVKSYRKTEFKTAFKFSQTQLPPIPNKTRWNNYFAMASILLKHRDFFSNLGSQYNELDLTDYWTFLEDYRDAFQPLYEASLKSQQEECPISQFHLEWLKAYGQIKALTSNRFKQNILLSMDRRQATLMGNGAYKAALYMDPRFMYSGSELFKREEKAEIVTYLLKLWNKINVNGTMSNVNAQETNSEVADDNNPVSNNSFDINDYFTQLFGEGTSSRSSKSTSLEEKLQQIQSQDRVSPAEKFNIIHYWYTQKVRDERLWQIAKVVFAAASTQAAVERDFSAYNRVFTNARNRMAGETIENVLKIKLNKDLVNPAIRDTVQPQVTS